MQEATEKTINDAEKANAGSAPQVLKEEDEARQMDSELAEQKNRRQSRSPQHSPSTHVSYPHPLATYETSRPSLPFTAAQLPPDTPEHVRQLQKAQQTQPLLLAFQKPE